MDRPDRTNGGQAGASASGWNWPEGGTHKAVNIALQGGGSHGAFTWGVLDRILEDGRLSIEAISGTSAGAMNAVVVAAGLVRGGPDEARSALAHFWRTVSREAPASPLIDNPLGIWLAGLGIDASVGLATADLVTRFFSPYQLNPLNINPIRDFLEREIDFDAVRACNCVRLFVSATNVLTGGVRVFTGAEITAEAVMASACLPHLFQAVEIDGEPYWDGGYMGNPVLSPFFDCCSSPDVVLVQINPIRRSQKPVTARDIADRVNEISFNAPLLRELRQVEFVNRCLERGELSGMGYRSVYLHAIAGGEDVDRLGAWTKFNASWPFLTALRDIGRRAADRFLDEHFDCIGARGTMDLTPFRDRRGYDQY